MNIHFINFCHHYVSESFICFECVILIKFLTVLLADLWSGREGISRKCKPCFSPAFMILYFTFLPVITIVSRILFFFSIDCSSKQVFGDKFDNFVTNFETSFRSTLMTLKLINTSSQSDNEQLQGERFEGCSCSTLSNMTSRNKDSASPPETTERESCALPDITEQQQRAGYQDIASQASSLRKGDSACLSSNTDGPVAFPDRQCHTHSEIEESVNLTSQQLVLHDKRVEQQLACASPSNQFSMLSTIEKSVMEQTRSNDLKTFEINLIMKKMQLKERELELHSNANILERWKLSMGISKASFKAEKFKTQLQDSGQVELLKKCLDFLVGGIIIMLSALAYGTYVYSHRRIVEATKACSPYTVRSILIATPPNEK